MRRPGSLPTGRSATCKRDCRGATGIRVTHWHADALNSHSHPTWAFQSGLPRPRPAATRRRTRRRSSTSTPATSNGRSTGCPRRAPSAPGASARTTCSTSWTFASARWTTGCWNLSDNGRLLPCPPDETRSSTLGHDESQNGSSDESHDGSHDGPALVRCQCGDYDVKRYQ